MKYQPLPQYEIHFRKWAGAHDVRERVVLHRNIRSLEAALALRMVSGDLVVDVATGRVVNDPAWLWEWEKEHPECYAQQAMRSG